ncbi:WG repeat-containing protein [Sunxiuqinia sp. A32]|uniref:WG repeat-containing protein n=1 Tax=Sunxiuqinia sp. A32 TaxID=3461496 RepID=UPI0040455001
MTKTKSLWAFFLLISSISYGQINLQNLVPTTNLFPVKCEGKWGFISNSGELIIEAQYDKCHPFYEGLALVEQGDDIWFVDETGEKAFDSPFTMSRIVSEGIIRILLDEKVGYIDKTGEVILEPKFKQGGDFSEGLAWVRLESTNNIGFIDKSGDMKILPVFEYAGDFHDGYAPVRLDGSWGYIDKSGKLFKNLIYTLTQDFSEGIAPIWKYGPDLIYIDKKGEELFRHRIYEPNNLPKGSWKVPSWGMHSGRIKVQNTNGLIGYLNDKGETEIDFQFSDGGDFIGNLAKVKSGSKWGFINKRGKMSISAQFDYAGDFNNGVAPVFQGGTEEDFENGKESVRLGYINQKGEFIWPYNN